jgi:GNAT superfamily N-acetyltransferase
MFDKLANTSIHPTSVRVAGGLVPPTTMLTAHPAATPPDRHAPSPSRWDLRLPVLTLAGARVDRIPTGVASKFVARLPDAAWTGDVALAVGAVTDSGELVGVAVLSPAHEEWARALVAVTPARRRLGLGADLLLVLVDGAANCALRGLACVLETDATPAQRLCRALGLEPRIVHSHHDADVIEILIQPRASRPDKPLLGRDRADR